VWKEVCVRQLLAAVVLAAAACATGRAETAAPAAPPLKVCMLSGSAEYNSDASLTEFKTFLDGRYNVACTLLFAKDSSDSMPGIEAVDSADLLAVFMRRITLKADDLAHVKKHCEAGKPVVGIRTASHAFQNWLAFDKVVLGGNYSGHYGNGPTCEVKFAEKAKGHPILAGVEPFTSRCSLYRNTGAAADIDLLATGVIPGHTEPLAWTRVHNGGRVFYTSLGGPDDFKNEPFRRLLVNAIFWTAGRNAEPRAFAPKP
jgi:type 1 glutamine amidotransferase